VYTLGTLLAYIRHWLSSRLCFLVFWKWGVTDHIMVDRRRANQTLLTSWCMMLTSKRQNAKLQCQPCHSSHGQLTLHFWSKLRDPKYFKVRQRRAPSFIGSHYGRSTMSRLNIVDIMMHDVNIEETKCKTSVLSLSLFSWSGYFGQSFEIQDIWKCAKEELFPLKDHITIDRRQADQTLVTLWCMMLTSKKRQMQNIKF